MRKFVPLLAAAILGLSLTAPAFASGNDVSTPSENPYKFTSGPGSVDVGEIATLELTPDQEFYDKENTIQMVLDSKGVLSGDEIGTLYPADVDEPWAVVFEYSDSGHIDDSDSRDIDADELLDSYKQGTAEQNRKVPVENQLEITGWNTEPAYDEALHSLTWAIAATDHDNKPIVNYNVKILTRTGYISAILITDPDNLSTYQSMLKNDILPKMTIKPGNTYEEFDASVDKKSEWGLSGLILGGAGLVAAKKLGLLLLLKKGWFVIVAAIVGIFSWIRRKLGRAKAEQEAEQQISDFYAQENGSTPQGPYNSSSYEAGAVPDSTRPEDELERGRREAAATNVQPVRKDRGSSDH
ncbi:DUF2167 domain-containing protein [Paenibacillus sp. JX-17]|uniref:DUF2167 domain-containing protein n=1 Tax=Paenibacillus lacisoli TaxID=3064525 RepID=A0ABT9CCS6_9BACL|nr:DUF2167 domain-containing protein [Paenibacillus sp. JX-17]MDO7907065.1 DUF2167 domain-containing protein [Paenibacillus sp. JX-17]